MQHPAPDRVLGPNTGVEQHEEVPEKPGDVVECHTEEHVDMDGVSRTSQGRNYD